MKYEGFLLGKFTGKKIFEKINELTENLVADTLERLAGDELETKIVRRPGDVFDIEINGESKFTFENCGEYASFRTQGPLIWEDDISKKRPFLPFDDNDIIKVIKDSPHSIVSSVWGGVQNLHTQYRVLADFCLFFGVPDNINFDQYSSFYDNPLSLSESKKVLESFDSNCFSPVYDLFKKNLYYFSKKQMLEVKEILNSNSGTLPNNRISEIVKIRPDTLREIFDMRVFNIEYELEKKLEIDLEDATRFKDRYIRLIDPSFFRNNLLSGSGESWYDFPPFIYTESKLIEKIAKELQYLHEVCYRVYKPDSPFTSL